MNRTEWVKRLSMFPYDDLRQKILEDWAFEATALEHDLERERQRAYEILVEARNRTECLERDLATITLDRDSWKAQVNLLHSGQARLASDLAAAQARIAELEQTNFDMWMEGHHHLDTPGG